MQTLYEMRGQFNPAIHLTRADRRLLFTASLRLLLERLRRGLPVTGNDLLRLIPLVDDVGEDSLQEARR